MRRAIACVVGVSLAWMAGCHGRDEKHGKTRHTPAPIATTRATAATPEPPAHGERPPKPRVIASIPPPNLPRLHAQASFRLPPEQKHKGKSVLDHYPCGTVWTGEEEVPLECEEPADQQKYGAPAVAIIPYEMLHAPKGDLPTTVDHRTDGFEGRVLAQGHAPACTAFAFTSLINHALGLWTGQPGDVSAMQIWARYHRPQSGRRVAANIGKSVARDADWPYDQDQARAWSKCKREAGCLGSDDERKLEALEGKGVAVVEEVEELPSGELFFDVMQAKLAAGRDVGTGGKLPKSFHPVGDAGAKYVPDFTEYAKGQHAFTAVGYTHIDGERYFLLKNSWGEKWGDRGYAWIHEATLKKIVSGGYVVVVDPVESTSLRRKKRKRAHGEACPAGQAPDSIDGTCLPLCADGGPHHAGYCGAAEDCTRGHVNMAGECVLAAPRARGTEPKSGISFACGASGCVYTFPKDVEGCATARCQKSCPAPDFRLGRAKGGLVCLE